MIEFKLKTKQLIDIDKEIFELNKFYSMAITSIGRFPNIYAFEEFIDHSNELKNKLKVIKTSDEFEKLFIENSLNNLNAQEIYLAYFCKGGIKVEEMIKEVFGKNALNILKENIQKFDYKKFWDYYMSYKDYSYKSLPADDELLREEFKKILINLKEDFLKYAKQNYGLPKNYDFELVLGQPYSQDTHFQPTNRRLEISPGSFFTFKEEGKKKINVTLVILNLFHEILGHGRQEILSREMPLSMQDNSINISIPCLHLHFEGVSQIAEKESMKFMREFREKYEIEDDYLTQRVLGQISIQTTNFGAFYKYLSLKKIGDNSINVYKEFKKITKNHGLAILYSSEIKSPLNFLEDAMYPLGLKYIEDYLRDLKEKIGEKYFNENLIEINKAIATGVFNFKNFPKFVDLYLKQKGVINIK